MFSDPEIITNLTSLSKYCILTSIIKLCDLRHCWQKIPAFSLSVITEMNVYIHYQHLYISVIKANAYVTKICKCVKTLHIFPCILQKWLCCKCWILPWLSANAIRNIKWSFRFCEIDPASIILIFSARHRLVGSVFASKIPVLWMGRTPFSLYLIGDKFPVAKWRFVIL